MTNSEVVTVVANLGSEFYDQLFNSNQDPEDKTEIQNPTEDSLTL